jgi:hypothetical protein
VTNAGGTGVNFGTSETINFSNGVSNGIVGAGGLMTLYKAESPTITATDTVNSLSNTVGVTVNAAAADHLTFLQNPSTTAAGSSIAPAVTVQVEDIYNNVRTQDNSTSVSMAIGTNPGGGTLSGTTPQTAVSGVATFSDLSINKTGTGYTLSASSSGITGATSGTFNITPAAVSYLVVTGVSGSMIAGASDELTITAYDTLNNVDTNYAGNISLTFSGVHTAPDGTSIPTVAGVDVGSSTTVHFTSGVSDSSVANLFAYKAESTTVNASDGSVNSIGHGLSLTVNPATAANFTITGSASQVAGATNNITITALDAYSNTVSSGVNNYTGTQSLTFSGSSVIGSNNPTVNATNFGSATNVSFSNGVASSVPMVLVNANESQPRSISATATGITTTTP